MAKDDKTNVMRVPDKAKIRYFSHAYEQDPTNSGEEISFNINEEDKYEKCFD